MMMMHAWDMGWPWLAMWVAFKITIWALLVTGLIFLVRRLRHGGACIARFASPLDVLKMRYAKGELSREEYDTMKRELQ